MNELMWACAILPEKEETAIKSICKRLNKGVGLPETVFRFPLHISLKRAGIVTDLKQRRQMLPII